MATLRLDNNGMVADPVLVLLTKSGKRLGALIGIDDIHYARHMSNPNEISFRVHKTVDGKLNPLWNELVDFKIIWYTDANETFEVEVSISEGDDTVKEVSGRSLAESELSQLYLFDVEINTEDDIARDDYTNPTVFYHKDPNRSLLNRMLYKAPHYEIGYVAPSIRNIQRTFSFDNKAITDALNEVAEEIGCVFVYGSGIDETTGKLIRSVSAYDLMNKCSDCGKRFEGDICPSCGSSNFVNGYGTDTGIIVTKDNLANDITYSSDTGSTKNCFHLVAGDDVMTAAIRSCNPNGSSYIWNITDEMRADMSDRLRSKLAAYDALYSQYATTKQFNVFPSNYNSVVNKYLAVKPDARHIYPGGREVSGNDIELTGVSSLVDAYYAILDLGVFLKTSMMPVYEYNVPPVADQCKLIESNIKTVGVTNADTASKTTVELAIKALAKCYVHTELYQVEVETQSYSTPIWTGTVTLTNYNDDTDTASTKTIRVTASSTAVTYMNDLIKKKIKDFGDAKYDITGLFQLDQASFAADLKNYSLDCLKSFDECCQACLSVLIDQGAGAVASDANSIYKDYRRRLAAIEAEIAVRESDLAKVGLPENHDGLLQSIINLLEQAHKTLDFETYVGTSLWNELLAYRREQEYSNTNYVSDGLSNAEIINNARDYYEAASQELYKSSKLQHSISASLANLLCMEEFRGLTDNFDVGNWLFIVVDDHPYKLRLVSYEIDFGSLQNITVDFSDITFVRNGATDLKSVIDSAKSIASSYGAVTRQATNGGLAKNEVDSWNKEGFDVTKTSIVSGSGTQDMVFDSSGILGRRWVDELDDYSPEQCKLYNTNLAFTNDNWETVSLALGKVTIDGEEKYGIMADNIVGTFGKFVKLSADQITSGTLDAAEITVVNLHATNVDLSGTFSSESFSESRGSERVFIRAGEFALYWDEKLRARIYHGRRAGDPDLEYNGNIILFAGDCDEYGNRTGESFRRTFIHATNMVHGFDGVDTFYGTISAKAYYCYNTYSSGAYTELDYDSLHVGYIKGSDHDYNGGIVTERYFAMNTEAQSTLTPTTLVVGKDDNDVYTGTAYAGSFRTYDGTTSSFISSTQLAVGWDKTSGSNVYTGELFIGDIIAHGYLSLKGQLYANGTGRYLAWRQVKDINNNTVWALCGFDTQQS